MGIIDLAKKVRNSILIEVDYFLPKEVGLSFKFFFLRLGLVGLLLKLIRALAKMTEYFSLHGSFLFESGYSRGN